MTADTEDKKYLWMWWASGDRDTSCVQTICSIAMPQFDEVGHYTWDEVLLLNKIAQEIPSPRWVEWGHDTNYATLNREMSEKFTTELMKKFNEQKGTTDKNNTDG